MHIVSSSDRNVAAANSATVSNSKNTTTHATRTQELAVLDRAHRKFEGLKETDYEHLESPDVFVKLDKVVEEGASPLIGRGITVVDTTLQDCAAWEWALSTREKSKSYCEGSGLEKNIVKLNDHSQLFHVVYDLGIPGSQPREWLTKIVWKKQDDGSLVNVFEDVKHDNFPEQSGKYVRAS